MAPGPLGWRREGTPSGIALGVDFCFICSVANAAQLEARLGLAPGQGFDPAKVPGVLNARAAAAAC